MEFFVAILLLAVFNIGYAWGRGAAARQAAEEFADLQREFDELSREARQISARAQAAIASINK